MRVSDRVGRWAAFLGLLVLEVLTLWGVPWRSTTELVLDLVIGVVALALVPLLLRRPAVAGVALGLLACLSPVATPAATCAVLVVGQRRTVRTTLWVAAVGVAGHLVQGLWRPYEGLSYAWWAFLVVVGYAMLVGWSAYLRAHHELILSLCERAARAEAEQARRVDEARLAERARIAREMHDVLAHRLSLVATHAGALEFRPDATPRQVTEAAAVVRAGVHEALGELRDVIHVLRETDEPTNGGRPAPPQPTLADLPRLLEENEAAGADVEIVDHTGALAHLPTGLSRTAYRVVQEALTNARRHAPGRPVCVTFTGSPGGTLEITVHNSLGPASVTSDPPGYGLVGLAERVELHGGELRHTRTKEAFELVARLAWPG